MHLRTKFVLMVLAVALPVTPVASETRAMWDFGRLPQGAEVKSKPGWAIDYVCDEELACSFYDPEQVDYLVWEDFLATKKFKVTPDNHHLIPFGINYNDDPAAIIKTVSLKTGLTFDCDTHADNAHIEVGILFCSAFIEDMLSLDLEFNSEHKLNYVEVWSKYM